MKRSLLFCAALLAIPAAPAAAGGINLTWGTGCWPDNPSVNRTFACDTDSGSSSFTGSFATSTDHPHFVGIEVIVDLQSTTSWGGGVLPPWWQFFNTGSCRQTSLTVSADFTAAPGACGDPWGGLAQGGIAAYQTATTAPASGSPNAARLKLAFALAYPSPLTAEIEYYGFRVTLNHAKTVGGARCPGCNAGVTIWLLSIKAAEDTGPLEVLTSPLNNSSITWQGGMTVPARNVTWGRVKGLYR
ncbi:MAG: hypothetical protein HZC42_03385 [Candidatus Eisenbacteria bacterium]|nr:hypothetical protein [Candidatus Eisenbacteria bacterium]